MAGFGTGNGSVCVCVTVCSSVCVLCVTMFCLVLAFACALVLLRPRVALLCKSASWIYLPTVGDLCRVAMLAECRTQASAMRSFDACVECAHSQPAVGAASCTQVGLPTQSKHLQQWY